MVTQTSYEAAISLIDEAHAQDPNIAIVDGHDVPWELHYAEKSTAFLEKRAPNASLVLRTAVRAGHFRRWEVPRSSYPMTKAGYIAWRSFLKKRQAELASGICVGCNYTDEEAARVGALIRKEGLGRKSKPKPKASSSSSAPDTQDSKSGTEEKSGSGSKSGQDEQGEDEKAGEEEEEDEVQILEDVACLVFLEEQLEEFEKGLDETKVVDILRKSWGKMSPKGRELALEIKMGDRARELVGLALNGDDEE